MDNKTKAPSLSTPQHNSKKFWQEKQKQIRDDDDHDSDDL
jgi:hypothetical protein